MSVSIASGSSLFPSVFQSVSFIYGENTTSIKLNTFSNYISSQNNLLGQGIGNIFALGESSIAGTIGDPRTITPTSFSSSDSAINIIAPIYTNSNFYFNELPCTTAINGSNTIITLNANNVINGSIASNFIGTSGTVPILNILLVSKSGNQVIAIYPGSFQTPSGWSLGTDITSITLVGQQLVPGSYYIEIPNFSINSSLVNIMTNEGNMIFSRGSSTTAYIDNSNDDTFDQFASNKTATITNMVNRIDAKIFTIRLHIRVPIGSFDSQDGTNRYWSITQSSAPNINSANPSVATIQNYIKYNLISYPPQTNSASYDIFAAANGAVILSNTGVIIAPFISYTTGILTIGLSLASIANLTSSVSGQIPSFIDFYIPVSVPYYALQSRALNYDKEKIQVEDLLKNVIGYQYGWGSGSYPDTVGNRLSSIETNLGGINTFQWRTQIYSLSGTFTTGSNTNLVMVDLVSGGGGGATGVGAPGGCGGSGAFSRILTTVTPNTTYTVGVGNGGGGASGGANRNGVIGSPSTWAGNFGTFTVTPGNGGTPTTGGTGGSGIARLPTVIAGCLVLLSYDGSAGANASSGNGGTLSVGGNAAFTPGAGGLAANASGGNGGLYGGGGGGSNSSGNAGSGGYGLVIVYY